MPDTFEFDLGEEVEISLRGTVEKRQDGLTGGNKYLLRYGPTNTHFWFYEDQLYVPDDGEPDTAAEIIPLRAA